MAEELFMTTKLSTKLAALGVALLVNGMMLGAVAYLFSAALHAPTGAAGMAQPAARSVTLPI